MGLANLMYAAVRTAIVAAWPEVQANGVFEEETLEAVPWDDLTPPYAAMIVTGEIPQGQGPTACQSFEVPMQIAYMGEVGEAAKWEALRDKLDTLQLYFMSNPLTFGQLLSIDAMQYGKQIETNSVFVAKNYSHRLAILSITLRYGYVGGLP